MPILPGVKFPSAASKADSLELNMVITVILEVIKEFSQGGWRGGGTCVHRCRCVPVGMP